MERGHARLVLVIYVDGLVFRVLQVDHLRHLLKVTLFRVIDKLVAQVQLLLPPGLPDYLVDSLRGQLRSRLEVI